LTLPEKTKFFAWHLQRKESLAWLKRKFELADKNEVKLMALNDGGLEPLWAEIGSLKR
jgi:hypothetical protein